MGQFRKVNSDKFENIQLEAARIVRGMTILASKDSLYVETVKEKLEYRRKLQMMLNVKNRC